MGTSSLEAEDYFWKFEVGTPVEKTTGDYTFRGEVMARFRKKNTGAERYVVENDEGLCFIFNEGQLDHVRY